MEVFQNGGTPKWMVFNGTSNLNGWFWHTMVKLHDKILHSCVCMYIYIFIFTCRVHIEGRKKHTGPQPQKWARVTAQNRRHVSNGWCRDACAVLQKACEVNLDSHKHCKDICTASGSVQDSGRIPRHPETSKLTYFRAAKQLHRSTTGFCEWQRWFLGSGARFACAYPHTSRGSSVKFAIRIGLAAKLLRICSKATKHGAALRTGLAAKLLRMRWKLLRTISQFVLARPQN